MSASAARAGLPPQPAASTGADRRVVDALLHDVAAGDHDAFAALYDLLGGVGYGLARRVVKDSALADEVIQDAFLNVWVKAAAFDPSRGSARSWVLMLVHRRAVDTVRREASNRQRLQRSADLTTEGAHDVVLDQVLRQAAADAADVEISRALTTLTPLQREAVNLTYLQGCTCAVAADLLNVPLATVKTRIRDGLIRLASEVQGFDPDPTQHDRKAMTTSRPSGGEVGPDPP